MPALFRSEARHLYRSRHGIWYFRWVVPVDVRQRFPQLPAELKRSAQTSNLRVAGRFARNLLSQLVSTTAVGGPHMPRSPESRLAAILGGLVKSPDAQANSAVARHQVVPMVIERDAITGRVTRVESQPHDTPQALDLIAEILRAEQAVAPTHSTGTARADAPAPVTAVSILPVGNPKSFLGDSITDYIAHLERKNKHSKNTLHYTWGPSLRIFRELISEKRRAFGPAGAAGTWDIQLQSITPELIDRFMADFWRYPTRQGKRPETNDAKEELVLGGEAQSRANALKRLQHIGALLTWLTKRNELDPAVVGRLEAETTGMAESREDTEQQVLDYDDEKDHDEDGYVAFSAGDLARLFHPEAYAAHAAGDAARYWIPVLGRYTGCRLNELAQACVRDVRTLDGIDCLFVTSNEIDANGAVVPAALRKKRVKTKAGRRTIPLHPEVIRLGFLDFVEERRQAKAKFLFDLAWFKKDAFGKYPSRDFRVLSRAVGVWERRRKVFHSFRATISQNLEGVALDPTLIDRFLGHSIGTVRSKHYNRNREGRTLPLRQVHDALSRLPGDLDIAAWSEIKNSRSRQLKGIAARLGFGAPAVPAQQRGES